MAGNYTIYSRSQIGKAMFSATATGLRSRFKVNKNAAAELLNSKQRAVLENLNLSLKSVRDYALAMSQAYNEAYRLYLISQNHPRPWSGFATGNLAREFNVTVIPSDIYMISGQKGGLQRGVEFDMFFRYPKYGGALADGVPDTPGVPVMPMVWWIKQKIKLGAWKGEVPDKSYQYRAIAVAIQKVHREHGIPATLPKWNQADELGIHPEVQRIYDRKFKGRKAYYTKLIANEIIKKNG